MENDLRIAYASQIIDRLGGTGAVATLFDIEDAAVSQWRRNGIPKPRMQFIAVARPDVLVGLAAQDSSGEASVCRRVLRARRVDRRAPRRMPDA
ncbi:Cro/CI family transcriptional regulator [Burkholderia territorii]|uniref:Cro/CI family transcriptional regulator n=1 Tax=Burkholderia territorii TaxID=1503055 RepID=UPI0009C0B4D4|nr:Cro/CI family transcriptional regulator [Burkholderia territorii]